MTFQNMIKETQHKIKMKKLSNIIILAMMAVMLAACSGENQEARTPVASITVNADRLEINQSMEIRFNGVADQVVIFTGDNGHDYDLRNESNTGFVMNKGLFTYSYSVPGKFKVVCVATTYDTYMGDNMKTDITTFEVTVSDDVTTIDKVSSSITPNIYYAELIDDVNWVMRVPAKQLYNNREIPLNATRQRQTFEIASDSSRIYVDNEPYAINNYYDLTKVHDIRVTANSGDRRDYKLYTLIYPEFKAISINGEKATLTRNAFYQNLQTYTFSLPQNTDISNVIPEFRLDDDVRFYAGDTEIKQGTAIDLTKTDVKYSLRRARTDNPDINAVSDVIFNITYK